MSAATATDATAAPASNQVKIENVGPARKRLTITIPAEAVDAKLEESMHALAHETALPGFRKGKVPKALLEKRFGSTLRTEARNQLVASAYAGAIEEHQLKPVGEPEPVDGPEAFAAIKLEPGKPITLALDVEVVPDFELPAFDGIEVKKPVLEIAEKHIDDEVKRQTIMHGTPENITEGFQEGDRIGGKATVTRNDESEPFFSQDNVLVIMPAEADGGKGQFLGLLIDDLHGLLKNKKVGDSITIDTVGPENHEREDIRGAKLHMTFEIRMAQRVMPASPEDVATRYGLPSVEILREQIKLALEHRRDQEQAAAMREQAIDALAEMIDFELPERMSAQQSARNLEQIRLELLYRGLSPEQAEEKLAEVRGESETATQARLKRFFILQKIGEHFNIEVSEQEVNGRIAAMAAQRGERPERLRNELAQAGRLGEVARMIRDQKAADRVVAVAKQVDVSAEEWNKIFEAQRKEKSSGKKKSAKAK